MKKVILLVLLILLFGCSNNIESDNKMNIKITIEDKEYMLNLENNETNKKLLDILPLEINMSDLNNNEKYYYLNDVLPTNASKIKDINKGDVYLYNNNCLVIFYKSFTTSYSYTYIGHINDLADLDNNSVLVKIEKEG